MDVSSDGLRVSIGTTKGTLGILDVASSEYSPLLRSHTSAIHAVAQDPNPDRNEFATASSDGSIRVWNLPTKAQLFEFDAPGETARCLAYKPNSASHDSYELAVGFDNGTIRVFDVPKTTMVVEYQQHRGSVSALVYSMDGKFLFSAGIDGHLVVYDVDNEDQA